MSLEVARQVDATSCGPWSIRNIKLYLFQRNRIANWLRNDKNLRFIWKKGARGECSNVRHDMYLLCKKEVDAIDVDELESRGIKRSARLPSDEPESEYSDGDERLMGRAEGTYRIKSRRRSLSMYIDETHLL